MPHHSRTHPLTFLAWACLMSALTLLLAACGPASVGQAASATATLPAQPPSPSATQAGPSNTIDLSQTILEHVALVSASEGWAIGTALNTDTTRGVILHLHNGAWSLYQTPQPLPGLFGLAMTSASDGWIVGASGTMLRYQNGAWVPFASPVPGDLTSLCMLSASEGWAGGTYGFLHYHQGAWTLVGDPNAPLVPFVNTISLASASEGWAMSQGAVLLRYTQGRWQIVVNDAGFNVYNLAMVSASEFWAVGQAAQRPNALHYNKGYWQPMQIGSSDVALYALTMLSPTEGWAAGSSSAGGVIFHYLNRQWKQVAAPSQVVLHAIAMLSPSEGWGVGENGKTLHYLNGVWS